MLRRAEAVAHRDPAMPKRLKRIREAMQREDWGVLEQAGDDNLYIAAIYEFLQAFSEEDRTLFEKEKDVNKMLSLRNGLLVFFAELAKKLKESERTEAESPHDHTEKLYDTIALLMPP